MHIRAPRSTARIGKPPPLLDASASNKVFSAEASWLYKFDEEGFSLQSCDDPNLLFKKMFPDCWAIHSFYTNGFLCKLWWIKSMVSQGDM